MYYAQPPSTSRINFFYADFADNGIVLPLFYMCQINFRSRILQGYQIIDVDGLITHRKIFALEHCHFNKSFVSAKSLALSKRK